MTASESADEVEALLSMATEVVPATGSSLNLTSLSNLDGNLITEVSMTELKPIVMTIANIANSVPEASSILTEDVGEVTAMPVQENDIQISERSETVLASHLVRGTPSASRSQVQRPISSEVYRDSTTGVTYEIQRGGTRRGGDKLIDSLGFTYNLKAGKGNKTTSYWWCAVRNQQLRCPASVTQRGDKFMRGKRKHEHLVGQCTPKADAQTRLSKILTVKPGRPVGTIKGKPARGVIKGTKDYKIVKNGSKAGMDLLKDCLGYTYTLKKVSADGTRVQWRCSVRNKYLRCSASALQHNHTITPGALEHNHMPGFNRPLGPHDKVPSLRRLKEQHELYDSDDEFEDEEEMDHSYGHSVKSGGPTYVGKPGNTRLKVAITREKKRREHQTFLGPRCTINLTKCDDPDCNCKLVHCPFCDKHHFKPTKAGRVQDHLELTHFAHGVQFDDLMIVKCFHDCNLEKSFGHYHCVFCFRQILKRTAYARHMARHMMKMGIPERLLVLPDSKYPDIINAYGYEIPICKGTHCGPPTREKHYHCPNCSQMCRERSLTVNHLWRCLQKKRDGATDASDDPDEEMMTAADDDQLVLHFSHVKAFKDIPVEKCTSIACCDQKYHCKLCPENVFMPTYRQHLIAHYVTHWKQRVLYKNWNILKCFHPCDGIDRSMCKTRYHYHCPICGRIILTKGTFEEHLQTCNMLKFGENLIQSTKVDTTQTIEDEINLTQESAPLNENVEFMEDQLTSQARENAEREKLSRRNIRPTKRKSFKNFGSRNNRGRKVAIKQEVEDEDSEDSEVEVKVDKKRDKPIVENDIYATCSAYISPKLAKKVKSTSHLKSILGGVAGATSVKLKVSGKGQYLLSGPAEELLEAQKMLTKTINKEMKGTKSALKVKVKPKVKTKAKIKAKAKAKTSSSTKTKKKAVPPKKAEVKKGRGRPKKDKGGDDSFPYSEIRQIIEASKGAKDDTPKRGRGRPPKNTAGKVQQASRKITVESLTAKKQKDKIVKARRPSPEPEVPKTPGRYGTRGVRKNYLAMSSGGYKTEIKQEPVSDPEDLYVEEVDRRSVRKAFSDKRKQAGKYGRKKIKDEEDDHESDHVNTESDVEDSMEGLDDEEIDEKGDEKNKKDTDDILGEESEDMDDSLSLYDDSDRELFDDDDIDDVEDSEKDTVDGDVKSDDTMGKVPIHEIKKSKTGTIKTLVPSVFKKGIRKPNFLGTQSKTADDGTIEIGNNTSKKEKDEIDNKCSLCEDHVAQSFADLTEHLKVFHHVYDPPRCDVCEIDFDTIQSLNHHLEKKHKPCRQKVKQTCDYPECEKSFASDNGLQGHVSRVHLGTPDVPKEKKYPCEKCTYKCNSMNDIFEHKRVEHEEPIKCQDCDKCFMTYQSLKSHNKLTHNTSSVSCTGCSKTFSNDAYLNKHMKYHSSAGFTCNICKKTLSSKASLKDHLETHKDPSERTYRYMCSYCGKRFRLKSNLQDHLNKHTGARPYKCDICQRAFGFRSMLMKHKIFVHSSERPFKCGICHKGFKLMNLLQNHITTHTNTSKHICPHCSKTFSTASTLKFHSQKCRGLTWKQNTVLQAQPGTLLVFTEPGPSNDVTPVEAGANTDVTPVEPGTSYDVTPVEPGTSIDVTSMEPGTSTDVTSMEPGTSTDVTSMEPVNESVDPELKLDGDQQLNLDTTEIAKDTQEMETAVEETNTEEMMEVEHSPVETEQTTVEVFACSECKATFNTYREAEIHVLTVHSAIPTHTEDAVAF